MGKTEGAANRIHLSSNPNTNISNWLPSVESSHPNKMGNTLEPLKNQFLYETLPGRLSVCISSKALSNDVDMFRDGQHRV